MDCNPIVMALVTSAFGIRERTLLGDAMLASAFVSYIGSFNASYRRELVMTIWIPDMVKYGPSNTGCPPT